MPSSSVRCLPGIFFLVSLTFVAPAVRGQESPYVVTYDHYLEEPGNLEIEYFSTFGTQRVGNDFHAFWAEFEYGATAWWTTELYLEGQTTFNESTIFTGYRWENRIRPLKSEHFINPILYFESERKNGADKILKEVEGHDVQADFLIPNAEARTEHIHELELKLILSSTVSSFCPQNFIAGVEMYGGLGDRYSFGLKDTSHYLAPAIAWNLPSGWTLRVSPGFGLNDNSHRFLLRWGISREISGFGEMVTRMFGGRR